MTMTHIRTVLALAVLSVPLTIVAQTQRPSFTAGDRRDAAEARPRALADVATHARQLGLQPARSGEPLEREPAADGLVARDGTGQRTGGDAARLRRRDVRAESQRLHLSPRREHRQTAVGVPAQAASRSREVPAVLLHQSQPRDLRQHHHRHERRRLHLRARRADRQAGVGDARSSTTRRARNRAQDRSSPTARSSPAAAASPKAAPTRASSPRTMRAPARSCGARARSRRRASRATRRGAACRSSGAITSARGWCRATTLS